MPKATGRPAAVMRPLAAADLGDDRGEGTIIAAEER